MPDFPTLAADPRWLPHRIDPAGGTLEFLHLDRDALSQTGFLADRSGETQAIPLGQVERSAIAAGPVHFILHTDPATRI